MDTKRQPFAARFAERIVEHEVPSVPYSDDLQRSVRDPRDVTNPVMLSPTSLSTTHGDETGDESH